jgi:hypothetical protein
MNVKGITGRTAGKRGAATDGAATAAPRVSCEAVWRALGKASFAVVSYVNPAGEPRSSGVLYATSGRRLYVVVAVDSWKARQIAAGQRVAVTVPVRRGGVLSLLAPIPPATISFEARATVHPAGSLDVGSVPHELSRLIPEERRAGSCVIELVPEGRFLTYGIGVSLMDMRVPDLARARVPVS